MIKIIHKWGEPTRTELFKSLLGDKSLSYAEVREDNLLEGKFTIFKIFTLYLINK